MKTDFAEIIYVINATEDGQSEFWAAAAPRRTAAAQVQQLLPPGWTATSMGWRLGRARAAELRMRPDSVRKLTHLPERLFLGLCHPRFQYAREGFW